VFEGLSEYRSDFTMAAKYSDSQIAGMIAERKPLPVNWRSRITLRDKRGHKEREMDIAGENGNEYRVILRQGNFNTLDFSVILALNSPASSQLFRLRRYNGKSHEHTNQLEGNTFYDFHIHYATERYQEFGGREDSFAEPSTTYSDFNSAVRCMFRDCGFEVPETEVANLFGEFDT